MNINHIDPIYNPMHVIMCLEKCIGNKKIRHDDAVNTMRDALTLINSYSNAIAKLQNENDRLITMIKSQQLEIESLKDSIEALYHEGVN